MTDVHMLRSLDDAAATAAPSDPLGGIVALVVLGGLAALLVVRWRVVTRRRSTDAELDADAERFARAVRDGATDIGAPLRVSSDAWSSHGFPPLAAIEVARHLVRRGWAMLPGYTLVRLLAGEPPTQVALTRNGWERFGQDARPVVVNGPASFGPGDQINSGTFTYTWTEIAPTLTELSRRLHESHAAVGRADVAEALASLDDVLRRRDERDPRLLPALREIHAFARDAAAGAAGGGILLLVQQAFGILG